MPKIGEVEANDVRSAVLRHVASLKRARLTQGAFSRHFSSKKELLREAIDEGFTQGRSCRQTKLISLWEISYDDTLRKLVLVQIV
jgi:AcrR family transcriptional regulator